MSWELDKTKQELREFVQEIVIENGPRYKNPKEWTHLYTDFFVSLHGMSYTLGHITALAVPCLILYNILD